MMAGTLSFKSLYFSGLVFLMLTLSTSGSFGQRIYASSYGWDHSSNTLLPVSSATVRNRDNAIDSDYANATSLEIAGLLASPYARYQLKFPNTLPAGTPVYIRMTGTSPLGLLNLGLLLASKTTVTPFKDALQGNTSNISGQRLGNSDFITDTITIDGVPLGVVIPSDEFNAITVTLDKDGLELLEIPLLNSGVINIYYAYYECPTFTITQSEPVCAGRPFTLTVSNPISTGQYQWFSDSIGGTPLFSGNPLSRTETLSGTRHYYVQHSQFSDACRRSGASVHVGNSPDNPDVDIQ